MSGRWLRRLSAGPAPRLRLLGLPHAGGTATTFANWPALLPTEVEMIAVQYPGRQDRIAEPYIEEMAEMADLVTAALRPLLDTPIVMFGHSMGSSLAYEVAVRLAREDGFVVDRIFVSARTSPHRIDGEPRHGLSDDELVAAMRRLGGPDLGVFDIPQLLPLILPPLRADLRLLDRHRPAAMTKLATPFTAFGGDQDETCPTTDLAEWADATSAGIDYRIFHGGHHYLRELEAAVVQEVVARLPCFEAGQPA